MIAPPTLLAGIIGGGVLGALHHKGLGLSAEDRDRIAAELTGGKAAVGVLAPPLRPRPSPTSSPSSVATAEIIEPTDEAIAEADAVAPTVEAAEAAAPEEVEAPVA